MYNELSKNIKSLRKARGYKSAQAFADDLNVHLKTVQGWENTENPKPPTLDNLIAICDLLECDIDYLLGRMEEPTHEIKFIHEKTGLSVEAIRKLISNKESVMDSPLSDIIVHDHAERLLRILLLASDEDEITWLDLDNLPRGLLSSYADKPIDFSVGIGADVADFLASQELASIMIDIRKRREEAKESNKKEHHWKEVYIPKYDVYEAKKEREKMFETIEEDLQNIYAAVIEQRDPDKRKKLEQLANRAHRLYMRIKNASYAEMKRGDIQKEFNEIYEEGEEE